jgi:restriction system protein
MAEMWMVRAGTGAFLVEEFIKNGYIAVGWLERTDLAEVKDKKELERLYDERYTDEKPGKRRAGISQISKFVLTMKVNDWAVTYHPKPRRYHIGIIRSGYFFAPQDNGAYRHRRRVDWKYNVGRDALAVPTRNSLGAIMTLFLVPARAQVDLMGAALGMVTEKK